MKWFQLALLVLEVCSLLLMLKVAVEGRERKAPEGFAGVCVAIFSWLVMAVVYYGAGAFSEWIP